MLPNGNFLLVIGVSSSAPARDGTTPAAINEIREVNLAGDTAREISINDLNNELAAATCAECNVSLITFHHYVTLPNGHWLLLANTTMALSSTTKPALTNEPPTTWTATWS